MNSHTTARRMSRNAVVLAAVPVAMLLMTGTASAAGNSGNIHQPQPLSNADQNGTGANPGTLDGCGAYCSTRDGSPSLNGNGGGTSTGKPCAGCVGKADNKNPKGQAPSGPVDHNNGYECDGNHGIGKGNPAHTACTAPVTPPVTPPVVTPPVVTPPKPVCKDHDAMGGGSGNGSKSCTPTPPVTPPAVTPPVVTPPVVTPPVVTPPVVTPPVVTPPVVTPPVVTPPVVTPEKPVVTPGKKPVVTPVGTPAGEGAGSVSGESTDQPVVLAHTPRGTTPAPAVGGGSAAAAQGPAGLPFTGDSTGQLGLFSLVLIAAGGGLVVGARRV